MKLDTCPYCARGAKLAEFGYLAYKTDTSLIIVFKEQTHKGRCIVAYRNDHIAEIKDLDDKERDLFMKDVSDAAKCIDEIYHPDRINYGAYGDKLGHLHFHLVPKYDGKDEWGDVFEMNPKKHMIDDNQCELIAAELRQAYSKLKK